MAQSAKFGLGQQKEKKFLLFCGAMQRLKGSMVISHRLKPSGVSRRGKPQLVHPSLHHTPPVTLLQRLPARAAEHLSLLLLSEGSPGKCGAVLVWSTALPKGQDTGVCQPGTCQASATPAHRHPRAGHKATMPRGAK